MSDTILLTGGTGFLGMAFVARMLEDEEGPDLLLAVRAADRAVATARVDEVLARLYDEPPASARRLRAVPAELTAPGAGLSAADRRDVVACVDRVVHCAASIAFTLPVAEAREINVGGTREVLALARELPGLEQLVHVSTAYVAGRSGGEFAETDLDVGQRFRNTYEQTKWEAEILVGRAGLPCTVVRPSIVVGESGSGWTSAFNVIYWPLQAFARGLLDEVPADPAGLIDLVPVDHVVDVMRAALGAEAGAGGTLHAVAGEHALRVDELVEITSALLGRPGPALRAPADGDPDHPAAVFAPYFDVGVRFGDARSRELGLVPPPAADLLPAILGYAREARWGKRPMSRQAARRRLVAIG